MCPAPLTDRTRFGQGNGTDAGPGDKGSKLVSLGAYGLCFGVLFALFYFASKHVFGSNSDDATLVLEAKSVLSGHIALGGWALSYDSFWTVEVPFYVVAVAIFGPVASLMNIVPAFIAALVVVIGIALIRERDWSLATAAGIVSFLALVAFPSPVLAFFMLQAGWHVGTALLCLLGFVGVAKERSRWALVGAIVALTAGLLGDLLTLAYGILPVAIAGLVALARQRSWRAGSRHLVAVVGALALALVVRVVAVAISSYSVEPRSVFASHPQMVYNVKLLLSRFAGLFGTSSIVGGLSGSPVWIRAGRAALLVIAVVVMIWLVLEMIRGVLYGSVPNEAKAPLASNSTDAEVGAMNQTSPLSKPWRLDDMLIVGSAGSVASFIVFSTVSSVALGRYLIVGYLFIALLVGRAMTRYTLQLSVIATRAMIGTVMVLLAICVTGFATESVGPTAPLTGRMLGTFLAEHHLYHGIGDYWSASIVTVDTAGAVEVRPVITDSKLKLVRYEKQSTSSWYQNVGFQFFVYDTSSVWNQVDSATAVKTFGTASQVYTVGPYAVLVWRHPVFVAP